LYQEGHGVEPDISGNEWMRGEVTRYFPFAQWIRIEWGPSMGANTTAIGSDQTVKMMTGE
jgi:hypothetical protein